MKRLTYILLFALVLYFAWDYFKKRNIKSNSKITDETNNQLMNINELSKQKILELEKVFSASVNSNLLSIADVANNKKNELQEILSQNIGTIQALAGENLNDNCLVVIIDNKAYLFDCTNESHFKKSIGFVTIGVLENQLANIYISGTINLRTPLIQNTKYFAGDNGNLIDVVPENYGIQSVGYAISSNQIILDFSERYIYT